MISKVEEFEENSPDNETKANNLLCRYCEDKNDFESFLFHQADEVMWKFCPPVIFMFGSFGNIMTIVIIRRMSEGQSSNSMFLYFTALAVSDQIILCVGLLRKWLIRAFGMDYVLFHDSLCKLQLFVVNTCGTISSWLIVSMTMQRVMSVVWPHYKSLSCTGKKVAFVISLIVGLCTCMNFYRLWAFTVMSYANSTVAVCANIDDEGLTYFDWYIYPWIDLVATSLVPFTILIFGNSVLLWKVIQSVQVARVMTAGSGDQVNSRQKKASSLTVSLITVSFAFLLLTLPICTFLILFPDVDIDTSSRLDFTWAVCNLSWYVNSAINFYLYCLSGSRFRSEVKNILCRPAIPIKMSSAFASLSTSISANNEF